MALGCVPVSFADKTLMRRSMKVYKTGNKILDKNYICGIYDDSIGHCACECCYVRFSHIVKMLGLNYKREYRLLVESDLLEVTRIYGNIFVDVDVLDDLLAHEDRFTLEQYDTFLEELKTAEYILYEYYRFHPDFGQFIDSDILYKRSFE